MPGFLITGREAESVTGRNPPNVAETLRQHRWRIKKLGPIDIGNFEIFIAESLQLPNVDIEIQEIKGALITYKFAKGVRWDDVTLTFYDTADLLPRLISGWRDKIYTNDAGIGTHVFNRSAGVAGEQDSYKQPSEFELLDGKGKCVLTVKLNNSWPRRIAHGPLSFAATDIKLVTMVLTYDFADFEQCSEGSAAPSSEQGQQPMMMSSNQSNQNAADRTTAANAGAQADVEEAEEPGPDPISQRRSRRRAASE